MEQTYRLHFLQSKSDLRRSEKESTNQFKRTVKDSAYKSLVHPKLEDCSTVWDPKKCKQHQGRWQGSQSIGRPAWNGPEKSNKVGYKKISQHIKYDRYAAQPGLEDSRTETFRFKAVYALQDRNNLIAIEKDKHLQRGTGRRSHQYRQLRADRDYTRFSFLSYNGINSQVRHARQPRSKPSKPRLRLSRTPRSINSQNIFYLFIFLSSSSFYLSLFLVICLIIFILPFCPFSHSTGDNPQSWVHW